MERAKDLQSGLHWECKPLFRRKFICIPNVSYFLDENSFAFPMQVTFQAKIHLHSQRKLLFRQKFICIPNASYFSDENSFAFTMQATF